MNELRATTFTGFDGDAVSNNEIVPALAESCRLVNLKNVPASARGDSHFENLFYGHLTEVCCLGPTPQFRYC